MGANRTQAVGVSVFLAAFVLIAAGMAAGGSLLLISPRSGAAGRRRIALFLRAKPWEHDGRAEEELWLS